VNAVVNDTTGSIFGSKKITQTIVNSKESANLTFPMTRQPLVITISPAKVIKNQSPRKKKSRKKKIKDFTSKNQVSKNSLITTRKRKSDNSEPEKVSKIHMEAENLGKMFSQEIKRKCKEKSLNSVIKSVRSASYPGGIPVSAVRDSNPDLYKLLTTPLPLLDVLKSIPPSKIEEYLVRMKNKLNFDDCEAMKTAIDQFKSEDKENSKARKNDEPPEESLNGSNSSSIIPSNSVFKSTFLDNPNSSSSNQRLPISEESNSSSSNRISPVPQPVMADQSILNKSPPEPKMPPRKMSNRQVDEFLVDQIEEFIDTPELMEDPEKLSDWSQKLQRDVVWIEERIIDLLDMMQEDAES